ncbi:YciI family protein [Kribbella albertanoniae]
MSGSKPETRESEMAQYMFLLFDSEEWYDNVTPEDWQQAMKLHGAFSEAVEKAGARILGGEALERSSTASTVKQREGSEPLVTDGPFLETKEALGGFYIVEARDLDQALELAKLCPAGNVEVRPVMDTSADSGPQA